MKSSKERKHDKKNKQLEMSARKTERSRARRLDNKAKRDEIHAINPNLKITIVDGTIYTDDGINGKVAVEVIDNKIKAVTPADYDDAVVEYQEVMDAEKTYNAESDGGRAINDQIEKERIGMFDKLAERFRKK